MPSASKDPTPNAAAHAKGKPFRLADFFSTLLMQMAMAVCCQTGKDDERA